MTASAARRAEAPRRKICALRPSEYRRYSLLIPGLQLGAVDSDPATNSPPPSQGDFLGQRHGHVQRHRVQSVIRLLLPLDPSRLGCRMSWTSAPPSLPHRWHRYPSAYSRTSLHGFRYDSGLSSDRMRLWRRSAMKSLATHLRAGGGDFEAGTSPYDEVTAGEYTGIYSLG